MTSVLIATNEPVLARGFEAILAGNGLEVVDICTDVVHLFESFQRCRPGIAILDMAVVPLTSVMVELRKLAPQCQLLVWLRQISEEQSQSILRSGARGVLPADVTPEVLLAALKLLTSSPPPEATPAAIVKHVCNPMEKRIISLVGCGMKDNEIAALVGADVRAVDQQVRSLSRRLGAQDRYELALYGLSMTGKTT
jgi:DNA-binding NarL/FixJ family response regulator